MSTIKEIVAKHFIDMSDIEIILGNDCDIILLPQHFAKRVDTIINELAENGHEGFKINTSNEYSIELLNWHK